MIFFRFLGVDLLYGEGIWGFRKKLVQFYICMDCIVFKFWDLKIWIFYIYIQVQEIQLDQSFFRFELIGRCCFLFIYFVCVCGVFYQVMSFGIEIGYFLKVFVFVKRRKQMFRSELLRELDLVFFNVVGKQEEGKFLLVVYRRKVGGKV